MRAHIRNTSNNQARDNGVRPRFWLIAGLILGLLLLWDVVGPFGLWKLHRMKEERKRLYFSNLEISKKNTILEKQINRIKDDPEYQEQIVRRELGWVRDNEILYRFIGEEE